MEYKITNSETGKDSWSEIGSNRREVKHKKPLEISPSKEINNTAFPVQIIAVAPCQRCSGSQGTSRTLWSQKRGDHEIVIIRKVSILYRVRLAGWT
jgi:hypothetical protein